MASMEHWHVGPHGEQQAVVVVTELAQTSLDDVVKFS